MENRFEHKPQGKGFTPVCTRMCRLKLLGSPNPLPHTLHFNGFSPVWTLIWVLMWSMRLNVLLQAMHLKMLSTSTPPGITSHSSPAAAVIGGAAGAAGAAGATGAAGAAGAGATGAGVVDASCVTAVTTCGVASVT